MSSTRPRPPASEQPADLSLVLDRRTLLGAASVGATVLLAGCGGGSSSATATTPAASPPSGGSSPKPGAGQTGSAATLVAVADVPVGGAVSAQTSDGQPVLVTQATAGDVKAFSAICTHRGCTVAPGGAQLVCPCHGSVYDLSGNVVSGLAPAPLPAISVKVKSGEVVTT
ncbi:MAG: Rieske 2Fe-2S domain-containing protein [Actinomycetes bacterium]